MKKFFAAASASVKSAARTAAVKVVKVCGGWAVFEYWTDYELWKMQK